MVNRRDYNRDAVEAARCVLLEVARLLGEYREDIVLVGGWVPELLIPEASHIGSLDVDLALNHHKLTESGYRMIGELLRSRGYRQGDQPFIFYRTVKVQEREINVQVDFLAGEYGGTGRSHRTQRVLDMRPRKARGVDLAFNAPIKTKMRGNLPDGGKDIVVINIASIPVFLIMKGTAIGDRIKEKDAWDIYFCLRNYPSTINALAQAFFPFLNSPVVEESLQNIREKFASPDTTGPVHVANFEEITDPEEREIIQRDAFERVSRLLSGIDAYKSSG